MALDLLLFLSNHSVQMVLLVHQDLLDQLLLLDQFPLSDQGSLADLDFPLHHLVQVVQVHLVLQAFLLGLVHPGVQQVHVVL